MFAVFVGTPDPFVLLYGISEEEFQWWVATANQESPSTLDMLYRLHDATGQRYNSRYQGD
jgi:hypothetical protein